MATILVVDDSPTNRALLVMMLGTNGYRLLEAADGAEALAMVRNQRPDLVITDILMPTMDGYEFVRQLRADPAVATIPVIYCTAHYHEQEARNLARACGVASVLTKPCEPEVVLGVVAAVLNATPVLPVPVAEEFDREHLRVVTDKLSEKVVLLRAANASLTAMVELGLTLGSELDPQHMLTTFCAAAREIIGARCALVGMPNRDEPHHTSGMGPELARQLELPDARHDVLAILFHGRGTYRAQNPDSNPHPVGLPETYPQFRSFLGVPIVSPKQTYGWLCLFDKLGADAFSDEDERLAGVLAAQVGRIFENGSLYADLLTHTGELNREILERKQAEGALRQSESRYRFLFDRNLAGVMLTRDDGAILGANDAAVQIFGVASRDELRRRGMTEFYFDAADRAALAENVVRDRAVTAREVRFRRADGQPVWALANISVVDEGPDGTVFLSTLFDITERKRTEEALREREEHIRLLLDSTAEAIYGMDLQGNCIMANPACARLLGYGTPHQLLAKHMHTLCHHTRADGTPYPDAECHIYQAFRRGEGTHVEDEVFWRLDGSNFPVEYWSYPIRREGQIVGAVVTFLDITERRRLEDQYRQAQQRLRHVVVSSPSVLFTLPVVADKTHGISWTSDNLPEILGYAPAAALGQDWWMDNVHPEDREHLIAQFQTDLLNQERSTYEYRFRHGDGSYRWTRCELRVIRDAAGRPAEVVGSWSDITERKHLEDQFRQAQKMEAIGRLAGGVAHDFNNLLTVINGYGELVLARLPAGDPIRELIKQIVGAGDRAAGLTRQLLAFSRKAILEPKILDLKALVTDVDKMLRRVIGEDIQLAVVLDPELGAVKADSGQVEQVIMNLVVNARDAMPHGGQLTIELHNTELDETYALAHPEARPGPHVLLAVSDTGHGMDQATMTRIFEPFFSTKGEQGTGLGLATVHGIVKQSGGHLGVYSELGHGTTFKVYLPRLAQRPAPGKSLPGPAVLPRGSETLLLVEDEDGVRALSRHVLRGCGYTVLEARNGAEAVRVAGEHTGRIDLLLTDVVMPRMSGRAVAEHLAGMHAGMKVLFVSGYTDDAVVRHGILEAEVAFLQKPFSPTSLVAKVREILDS